MLKIKQDLFYVAIKNKKGILSIIVIFLINQGFVIVLPHRLQAALWNYLNRLFLYLFMKQLHLVVLQATSKTCHHVAVEMSQVRWVPPITPSSISHTLVSICHPFQPRQSVSQSVYEHQDKPEGWTLFPNHTLLQLPLLSVSFVLFLLPTVGCYCILCITQLHSSLFSSW